jgi:hypothetical protein
VSAYHDERAAEAARNEACGRPGKPAICKTHPCYVAGGNAYYGGQTSCPYAAGTSAALHWELGWNDAARADDIAEKNGDAAGDRPWMIGY